MFTLQPRQLHQTGSTVIQWRTHLSADDHPRARYPRSGTSIGAVEAKGTPPSLLFSSVALEAPRSTPGGPPRSVATRPSTDCGDGLRPRRSPTGSRLLACVDPLAPRIGRPSHRHGKRAYESTTDATGSTGTAAPMTCHCHGDCFRHGLQPALGTHGVSAQSPSGTRRRSSTARRSRACARPT